MQPPDKLAFHHQPSEQTKQTCAGAEDLLLSNALPAALPARLLHRTLLRSLPFPLLPLTASPTAPPASSNPALHPIPLPWHVGLHDSSAMGTALAISLRAHPTFPHISLVLGSEELKR